MRIPRPGRSLPALLLCGAALVAGGLGSLVGACGPFTDFTDAGFCPYVLEIFTLGITTGTTPTTYDPSSPVTRLQMAAFLSRTVDSAVRRGGQRAALRQFWKPSGTHWAAMALTTVGSVSNLKTQLPASDGSDIWVPNSYPDHSVARVRASDGALVETWTGATLACGAIAALGRVLVTGSMGYTGGNLYMIDPREPPGSVSLVSSDLGQDPCAIAFDGQRFWTANYSYQLNWGEGSISIITPTPAVPWDVSTVTAFSWPTGIVYDGANVWVADLEHGLSKLDGNGAILQSVTIHQPEFPTFDGTNLWVPAYGSDPEQCVKVIRASSGAVLATLTGNGLDWPMSAAFDGERILVTSMPGNRVSLWKAADLTPIGNFYTGDFTWPVGACSDGVNFWIALTSKGALLRF